MVLKVDDIKDIYCIVHQNRVHTGHLYPDSCATTSIALQQLLYFKLFTGMDKGIALINQATAFDEKSLYI